MCERSIKKRIKKFKGDTAKPVCVKSSIHTTNVTVPCKRKVATTRCYNVSGLQNTGLARNKRRWSMQSYEQSDSFNAPTRSFTTYLLVLVSTTTPHLAHLALLKAVFRADELEPWHPPPRMIHSFLCRFCRLGSETQPLRLGE